MTLPEKIESLKSEIRKAHNNRGELTRLRGELRFRVRQYIKQKEQ